MLAHNAISVYPFGRTFRADDRRPDDRRGPPREIRRDNRSDKRDFNRDRDYQR